MSKHGNHQDDDVNMHVADNIRAELARQRWSGRQAALALGLHPNYVSRRLAGETPLDAADITMFADFLNVPVADLFEGTKKAPHPRKGEGRGAHTNRRLIAA